MLYSYQVETIDYALRHNYCILGLEQGLGKTLCAIKVALNDLPALVICPSYLKGVWFDEIKKFHPEVLDKFTIVSYNMFHKLPLHNLGFNTVIADECHYLKNPEAIRTQNFKEMLLTYKPKRFLGLSGTPIKNRVGEFYSLFELCGLNPARNSGLIVQDKYNYWQFLHRFSNAIKFKIKNRTLTKFEGHRNTEELKTYLKDKYIRFKSIDVLDLPEIVERDVVVETNIKNFELLNDFDKTTSFSSYKVVSAMAKVEHTFNYVKDLLEAVECVVIFTDHVDPAEALYRRFTDASISATYITGQTDSEKRMQQIKNFQLGKTQVQIGTIGSMSVGFTLTRSHHVIFNDISWVPGDNAQAMKRIHRIGQTERTFVHYILSNQADRQILRAVKSKMNTIDTVL